MPSVGIQFKGLPQLRRRIDAIGELGPFMRDLALAAVSEQKQRAPVRTGNLRRTIHLGRVTERSAETIASAKYAAYVEFGTKPHEIRPRYRRALRWKDRGGSFRFARAVHHPGTRAKPYMIPGAETALSKLGISSIVKRWNDAV